MLNRLDTPPVRVTAGAIYPYSETLLSLGARGSAFGDAYNLFSVIGDEKQRRILVPRNMVPLGTPTDFSEGVSVSFSSKFVPRNSEQARIIQDSVQLIAQGESFIVEAPTASGKTAMAMDIIAKVGKKTLVVVTKEDIRDQWISEAQKFLGLLPSEVGLIQGNSFQVSGRKLVIALVHSLAKEGRYPAKQLEEFGLCLFDECHHIAADFFSQSAFRVPAKVRVGLSATPDRKDGKMEVILAHIGPVMVRSTLANMVPKVIVRASPWEIPLSRVRQKDGTVRLGPIPHSPGKCGHITNLLTKCHSRNMLLATFTVAAFKKGRSILVQSDRLEHLETLAMLFQESGIHASNIAYYVGGMTEAQRTAAKEKRIIMATYAMTADATNIPKLDTLVMATPRSDIRQIAGRILRIFEGKQHPIIFDVVDSSSSVFSGYWNARRKWYASIGAEVSMR